MCLIESSCLLFLELQFSHLQSEIQKYKSQCVRQLSFTFDIRTSTVVPISRVADVGVILLFETVIRVAGDSIPPTAFVVSV